MQFVRKKQVAIGHFDRYPVRSDLDSLVHFGLIGDHRSSGIGGKQMIAFSDRTGQPHGITTSMRRFSNMILFGSYITVEWWGLPNHERWLVAADNKPSDCIFPVKAVSGEANPCHSRPERSAAFSGRSDRETV